MSGGFFRGTSADQDTRFSNKQAKLLKSQKFSPELEHLVDMTKVKMDVIKPWIANRVTELLGFEDEVLINFIYGLLEKKEVNGKEVQISLTGFMEKNTVKFMKELWTLLLSAQKNVSGVPQQFLDAKEEENKKKKAEADRIANEIEKNKSKESRELEQERMKKMDDMAEMSGLNSALEPNLKPRALSNLSKDEELADKRNNGVRGRNRVSESPHPAKRSPSSPRGSPSRSISRSFSNAKSHSEHKSRSSSRSPKARGRSNSVGRVYRSPLRSVTPHRRHSPLHSRSPSRRMSSYSRRRSRSRSHRRSPSPVRRRLRSPFRRRSPSPVRRRRSPSPVRRRRSPSPFRRRRSPSPIRRRRSPSPVRRRRSPSPIRRRRSPSPVRRHRSPSPIRRRSPSLVHRRSLSPIRRRSPSPIRHRSPSPFRRGSPVQPQYRRSPPRRISPLMRRRSPIPIRRRSSTPSLRRSPSPYRSSSSSPIQRTSPSPIRRKSPTQRRSPMPSSRERIRTHEKLPPLARRSSSSLRSPQRDPRVRGDIRKKVSVSKSSPERSLSVSESPPLARNRVHSEDRKSFSPRQSPVRQTGKQVSRDGSFSSAQNPHYDSLETSEEREEPNFAREDVDHTSKLSQKRSVHSSAVNKQKDSPIKVRYKDGLAPKGLADHQVTESQAAPDIMELRRKGEEIRSDKSSGRAVPPESPTLYKDSSLGDGKHPSYPGESTDEKNRSRPNNVNSNQRDADDVQDSIGKVDHNNQTAPYDSSSEKSDKHKSEYKKRRKHKRSDRKEVDLDDDDSYDSELEDRKEAKRRRRKEEKKLRKEEKRRRRDERRRRREERRAGKLKVKNQDDVYSSEVEHTARRESHPSDDEEMQSEQKRLEIELRKKALESLKAKKGISH
ncbi:hypothetical protein I3760_13G087500 [Carya illinoinensis]|uniref:PWI domain-containing protein n=3 Tax=Carya illinoinensis TaxID=32201 RepID=A0A922AMV8_CARIL|nr:serine/arginine repetitive matrix protein 1 isoform X2 [Carya illinoinensis]KAG2673362.1 hypothetical protein I3760_13G087500 [Carya illinoinensis]KAG2673363.1 hypothetical protein I3760_13G087500 [Carya illinoinensis]KAG6681332.1 hypothetical protein I3842_13G088200 [Carya illinoinensis]KAG6681333.1 hypothetical protein I3842_13G088200 [Carya illinoinensis]